MTHHVLGEHLGQPEPCVQPLGPLRERLRGDGQRRVTGPVARPLQQPPAQPLAAACGVHHAGGDGAGVAHGDRGRRHQGARGVTGRDRLPDQHPSAQHLLPDEQRHPSVGFQAGMGEGAQLVEGVVLQLAPGQVVDHGFTIGVWPHFTRRGRHR